MLCGLSSCLGRVPWATPKPTALSCLNSIWEMAEGAICSPAQDSIFLSFPKLNAKPIRSTYLRLGSSKEGLGWAD